MKTTFYFLIIILFLGCKKEEVPPVIADFEFTIQNNGRVIFSNLSVNAETHEWDFGTGDRSFEQNPTYTYKENRVFTVTLTVKGKGGQNSKPRTVNITTVPTTGRCAFFTTCGNNGFIDVTVNGVNEGRLTKCYNSGTPNCGDDGTVSITRPAGVYSFTAKAQSGTTWAGNITIVNGACSSMRLNQ